MLANYMIIVDKPNLKPGGPQGYRATVMFTTGSQPSDKAWETANEMIAHLRRELQRAFDQEGITVEYRGTNYITVDQAMDAVLGDQERWERLPPRI